MSAPATAPLEVRGLTKHFPAGNGLINRGRVHAVDDVSFALRPGTITALVGESGSGKSTVARLIARLYEPTAGLVLFEGADASESRRRRDVVRYRSNVQMIFQDPFGSLNPVKTIRHHLARPLRIHGRASRDGIDRRVEQLLVTVGLVPAAQYAAKYPHELSGGQRQRVAIARALAGGPACVLADEPTGNLDRETADGVFALMLNLARQQGMAFVMVSHDPTLASRCDRVLKLKHGRLTI
jgi:peptide/nickel transport system ATP-binding protein